MYVIGHAYRNLSQQVSTPPQKKLQLIRELGENAVLT